MPAAISPRRGGSTPLGWAACNCNEKTAVRKSRSCVVCMYVSEHGSEHPPSQPVGGEGSERLSLRVQFPEQQRGAYSLPLPPPCFGGCRGGGAVRRGTETKEHSKTQRAFGVGLIGAQRTLASAASSGIVLACIKVAYAASFRYFLRCTVSACGRCHRQLRELT